MLFIQQRLGTVDVSDLMQTEMGAVQVLLVVTYAMSIQIGQPTAATSMHCLAALLKVRYSSHSSISDTCRTGIMGKCM